MRIRLHQSDEVLKDNILPLISSENGIVVVELFMSKDAVKNLQKGKDYVIGV